MKNLINKNGTNEAEILDFTASGTYHANGGNDTINIKGGKVVVYTDSGNNTINVTGGSGHTIQVAKTIKEGNTVNGVEKLTINGANAVDAILGAGSDVIVIEKSNGKKANGAFSAIRGGAWGDTFTVYDGAESYQLYGEEGNDTFYIKGGKNMNFWGGAANDTFNVTGGSNNKLYGGDSADTFEISADRQIMILGYGKDTVNVRAGDKQQIKANLGINTINLKAGSGHVITSDVDKTASKKRGFTDADIAAGKGVGFGADTLNIDGATNVTAHLGDGKDVVTVSSGSGHKIYTEGWGDTIYIKGGTNSLIDAGEGDNVIEVKTNTSVITNNIVKSGSGRDTYTINGSGYSIDCGAGNDTVTINGGNKNTLNLGDGNDQLTIKSYAEITNTTINCGTGDDIVDIDYQGVYEGCSIDGGEGNDTINIGHSIKSKFYGGSGDDVINLGKDNYSYGYSKYNYVNAGSGNDTLNLLSAKYSVIDSGTGNNEITITSYSNNNYIGASDGIDRIECRGDSNIVYAGSGDDIINLTTSNSEENKIYAGSGNDVIYINNGAVHNSIYGGTGNDTFSIESYYNTCDGGAGDDKFILGKSAENNLIIAGAGNDFIGLNCDQYGYPTNCIDLKTNRGSNDNDVVNIAGVAAESLGYKYDEANDILSVGRVYIQGISLASKICFGSRDAATTGTQCFTGKELINFAKAGHGYSYQTASLAAAVMKFGECGYSISISNLCGELENAHQGITSTIKLATSNV